MMARIRTIKPEFFRHRELQDLAKKHGAEIMLVYIGLWTQCDRDGNFLWDEDQLALDILPFLGIKIRKSLDVLETTKYIRKYFSGKTYGHIPTFYEHQMIFGSERKYPAKYPPFNDLNPLYTQGNTEGRPRTLELRNNGIRNNGEVEEVPPSRDDSRVESKSKKEFPEESDPYQAAKYLARYITEWDQSVKITPQKIQGWAREADLMNRVDGRSWVEFRELVAWFDAGKHKPSKSGFSWAKVIRSMGSIREKWNDGKFYEFQEYMAKSST